MLGAGGAALDTKSAAAITVSAVLSANPDRIRRERRTHLDTAAADAVLAPDKNIENNPMQSRMGSLA
jgi:hypothetical protein